MITWKTFKVFFFLLVLMIDLRVSWCEKNVKFKLKNERYLLYFKHITQKVCISHQTWLYENYFDYLQVPRGCIWLDFGHILIHLCYIFIMLQTDHTNSESMCIHKEEIKINQNKIDVGLLTGKVYFTEQHKRLT